MRSRRLATFALIALIAVSVGIGPAAGSGSDDPPGGTPAADADAGGDGQTRRITLLTGDVVIWHRNPDGDEGAWLAPPPRSAREGRAPVSYEQDGEVHLVPADAWPYVQSGALDSHLFNISLLVENGYDDRTRADWPLLIQGAERWAPERHRALRPTYRSTTFSPASAWSP